MNYRNGDMEYFQGLSSLDQNRARDIVNSMDTNMPRANGHLSKENDRFLKPMISSRSKPTPYNGLQIECLRGI